MHSNTREIDITKSVKMIDWLKTELLASVGDLFKATVKGKEELILDSISSIIITTYMLGKRLGFSYARIDLHVQNKLRDSLVKGNGREEWYQDLAGLHNFMEEKRR